MAKIGYVKRDDNDGKGLLIREHYTAMVKGAKNSKTFIALKTAEQTGKGYLAEDLEIGFEEQAIVEQWIADKNAVRPVITYEEFQDRFTSQEFNDTTDFIYEADTVTGKPKRRALIQGLSGSIARNAVDLLHTKTIAFMDALVDGGIITNTRKDTILTP